MSQLRRRNLSSSIDKIPYPDHIFFNWRSGKDTENPNKIFLGVNNVKQHINSLIIDGVVVADIDNIVNYGNSKVWIDATRDYHEIYVRFNPVGNAHRITIYADTVIRMPYNISTIMAGSSLGCWMAFDSPGGVLYVLDPIPGKIAPATRRSDNTFATEVRVAYNTNYSKIFIPKGSFTDYASARTFGYTSNGLINITEELDFNY